MPSAKSEQKGDSPVPFFLLVALLVLAIVVLLLAVYFVVTRWL
jgi:cobalamin biosynthesis Mg chelatase CobN